MQTLLSFLLIAAGAFAPAAAPELLGKWEGADTAAMGIYGALTIGKSTITWEDKSHSPRCHANYVLVKEASGVKFEDQVGQVYVTSVDSKFRTFLLKLNKPTCKGIAPSIRLTIFPESPNSLDLVEYNEGGTPGGWMHFGRH